MRALLGLCVLVGCAPPTQPLRDDTWIFDPSTSGWSPGPMLPSPVAAHQAVRLADDSILLVGGVRMEDGADLVRCDTHSNACVEIGALQTPREFPDAISLSDEHVLVSGLVGYAPEIVDPHSGVAKAVPFEGMDRAKLVRLATGDALGVSDHAAILQSNSETWRPTIAPDVPADVLVSLTAQDVLLLTSSNNTQLVGRRFDAQAEQWTVVPTITTEHWACTATQLADTRILIVGQGAPPGELVDLATGTVGSTCDSRCARSGHATTLLLDGRVLVTGGSNSSGTDVLVYSPAANEWTTLLSPMPSRTYHSATLLGDGRVFIAGGDTGYLDGRSAD